MRPAGGVPAAGDDRSVHVPDAMSYSCKSDLTNRAKLGGKAGLKHRAGVTARSDCWHRHAPHQLRIEQSQDAAVRLSRKLGA
eukprot:3356239-Rhodomonas_salina.2